jgi:hypothetical protein
MNLLQIERQQLFGILMSVDDNRDGTISLEEIQILINDLEL